MSGMIFQEADFFAVSFLYGVFLLAAYDLLRIFRRTFVHKKGSVAAEDMIFWVIGGILVFRMMYEKNDGILRGTAFLAMGAGMTLYHYSISGFVVKLGYGLFGRPVKKICSILVRGLQKMQKAVKLVVRAEKVKKEEEGYDKGKENRTKRSRKSHKKPT